MASLILPLFLHWYAPLSKNTSKQMTKSPQPGWYFDKNAWAWRV